MRERRKNFRVEWNSPAKIYDHDGRFARLCIVSNFSNGGAKIIGLERSTIPDEFILRISPRGRAQRCHVIRRSKEGLGGGIYRRRQRYQRASTRSAAKIVLLTRREPSAVGLSTLAATNSITQLHQYGNNPSPFNSQCCRAMFALRVLQY